MGTGDFLPGVTGIHESVMQGRYAIRVIARNGDINEQVDIEKCGDGQWQQTVKMNGAGEKENGLWQGRPGCHPKQTSH